MASQALTKENKIMSFTVPMVLVGIIIIMIIPIPAFFLDMLLALNITLSLIILFVSLYLDRPLEFSSYPSLLLMTTLFRLAMNISSTRLILLYGDQGLGAAGNIIQAFGNFVLGGNFVIGVIIFSIIVLVNFMVITKGSGRIAEVAARFTLDAMPGKQMAIDSDLNSGLISENEAKRARKDIAAEAEFYGSMDGASKFVRGDAVAGIIITFINVLGGLFIGIVMHGMEALDAAETYTLLTVGDGLVSQIPALIVSTSAGMIVARAASGSDLGTEVGSQLTKHSKPLLLSSGVALFFALVPGLPFFPFLALGIVTGVLGINVIGRAEPEEELDEGRPTAPSAPAPGSAEEARSLLAVDLLELEVGYELVPIVDAASGGELIDRIRALRRQFALEMGFIVPAIHIRDNVRLEPNEYRLMLKGVAVGGGHVKPHHYLAMDPGGVEIKIPGIPTKEPAFGLDALWISEADRERAQFAGYTVVDPATVVTTHLTEIIRSNAHEIVGRQEVQELLDTIAKSHPKLVEDVVPSIVSLGLLQQVISGLLRGGVSVRDLRTILETLADWTPATKNPERLIEHVRQALARAITAANTSADGVLTLVSLTPQLERTLSECLQVTEQGSYLALEPNVAQRFISKLRKATEKFAQLGQTPILLAPSVMRAAVANFVERFSPGYVVLSHQEVTPQTRVKSLGVVGLEE